MTGSESQRIFVVVDVADPRRMKVVAELEAGMYAARNLCRHGNLALVNYYRWINAIDVANPGTPEFLAGCQWEVDPWQAEVPPFYRFQTFGKHLVVACGKPQVGLRSYRIGRLFLPRPAATVDLSDRLDAACVALMKDPNNWYLNAEMIVDGSTVHTSLGTSIAGFDLSDPEKPVVLYCQKMPAYVAGLAKAGRTLYVAVNSRVRHSLQADPAAHAGVPGGVDGACCAPVSGLVCAQPLFPLARSVPGGLVGGCRGLDRRYPRPLPTARDAPKNGGAH